MKKPTSKMLEIMERIAQGGQVHWDPFFCNSVDAHSSAVASMLRRGLVQTQPGTRALALTDKGKAEITVNRRRMTIIVQEKRDIVQELKELEAKTTPGEWTWGDFRLSQNAVFCVAMRNALPELLQKVQQLDAAEARAVEAERQRDKLALELVNRTASLHGKFAGAETDCGYPVFKTQKEAVASILAWVAQGEHRDFARAENPAGALVGGAS